jgi:hypothetical protein
MAKQFVQPPGARPPPDVEIAGLQNISFAMGIPQEVLGTDNHWIHASIHLDYLDTVSQMTQKGEMDLAAGVTTLNTGLQHVYQHYEPLAQDTGRKPEAKAVHKKMQNIGAIAQQQGGKLDKMQREAQAQQAQPTQGAADPALEQQQTLAHNDALFQQKLAHNEAMVQQEQRHKEQLQALKLRTDDLVAAQKITMERLKNSPGLNGA